MWNNQKKGFSYIMKLSLMNTNIIYKSIYTTELLNSDWSEDFDSLFITAALTVVL